MKKGFEYFCDDIENVENYEIAKADNFVLWDCHHRLETHTSDGDRRLVDITKKELIALDMYYHRPASELIFMPRKNHLSLHNSGKHLTDETKHKMSEARKCKKHSEETRKKLSEVHKGHSTPEETRKKISEANKVSMKGNQCHKGCHHSEEARKKMSVAWDYDKHCTEEFRKKISETFKSLRWFNNGERNIRAKERPDGFVPGRLKMKQRK